MEQSVLYANYHTHTPRCYHARGAEREYIEAAIRAGMKILGFADHAPITYPPTFHSGMRMEVDKTEDYAMTLAALREEYKSDIRILIGYELEYLPEFFEESLKNICSYPVDYLIMGQHFIKNDETPQCYMGNRMAEEWKLAMYVDQTLEGLKTGVFSYLAHPDLPFFTGEDAVYQKHMTRLCEGVRALDLPFEINLLGLWDHRQYPCDRFWSIASQVGCKAIFGCDAHSPDMLENRQAYRDACAFAQRHALTVIEDLPLRDPREYFASKEME